MSAPLLALEAVRAHRGAFSLGPATLAVQRGEIAAVVGPNGAGKSTLLAVALGELGLSDGRVLLGGRDPRRLRRPEVAALAAVLRQGGSPAFSQSAFEVVLHGRWVHMSGLRFPGAADVDAARAALASVGALELGDRDFRTLSGGEQQRVLLAKALAQGGPLLLLDEPTASLDLAQRAVFARLVRSVAAGRSLGVVLVTHDLELAATLATKALLLRAGEQVAAGPTTEVFRDGPLSEAFGTSLVAEWSGPKVRIWAADQG